MAVITISRGSLTGGGKLAEKLHGRLGYELVSREVLLEAAKSYGVDEATLAEGIEEPSGLWQRLTHEKERYILAVQAALAERVEKGNVIYHGHAGQFLLRELPCVIKLRLIAPTEYRVQAALVEFGMAREEALAHIEKIDDKRARWVRQMYAEDWADPSLYDLVINLANVTADAAADMVVDLVRNRERSPIPNRDVQARDFTLRTRVRAVLVFEAGISREAAQVQARKGVVDLGESAEILKRKDELLALVKKLPGVQRVIAGGAEVAGGADVTPQSKRVSDVVIPISSYPHVYERNTVGETLGAIGGSSVKLEDGYLVQPRYVLVLDENNALVGVVSRRDLLRGLGLSPQQRALADAHGTFDHMAPYDDFSQSLTDDWVTLFGPSAVRNAGEPVHTVMAPIKGAVSLSDDLSGVVGTMLKMGIDLVPVLLDGRAVGVVLMTDVFDQVAEYVAENAG